MDNGFLIDMDGVIYRGNQLIPGADRFIETLKREVHLPISHQQQPANATGRCDETQPHGHRRRRTACLYLRDGDREILSAAKAVRYGLRDR